MKSETTNTTVEILREYLMQNLNISEIGEDVDIFEAGLANSLFAIEMMTYLEKTFSIKVSMEDLDMENFKSIHNINRFVQSKKNN